MKTRKIKFRNIDVEINDEALASFKVQKAIAQMQTNIGRAFDALDLVFGGKLDELIDTIPDENGKPYKYGAPADVIADLITQAVENSPELKNA
jgi:hypothetical protein